MATRMISMIPGGMSRREGVAVTSLGRSRAVLCTIKRKMSELSGIRDEGVSPKRRYTYGNVIKDENGIFARLL